MPNLRTKFLTLPALTPGQSRATTPTLTTLVNFNFSNGSQPDANLIADTSGNIFGTTAFGGANGQGTVFDIVNTKSGYATSPTTLYSFCAKTNCADGMNPTAPLIADASGNLFGTTYLGGAYGSGMVFEITKTNTGYAASPTTLYSFCAKTNCADGEAPLAGLIADDNGNLFGTTGGGGANGQGTVFEIVNTNSGYATSPTTLYSFCAITNCADGRYPFAGLIADASGNLLGTTAAGGAHDDWGTVFEIAKIGDSYATMPTILYSFCAKVNCTDGANPTTVLIADASGNLFGTTGGGGANGRGTVFEIAKIGDSYATMPTILYSFCAKTNCTDGAEPSGRLIADANGNLFGTTEFGGANDRGVVFEIANTANGYSDFPTILYDFCAQSGCTDGEQPRSGLIADASGNLLGTTNLGGAYGYGTVFEITDSGFIAALPVPISGMACNGTYNGIFHGNITVSAGQNCQFINGGQITGNVTMTGGNFVLNGSSVGVNLVLNGGGTFTLGPGATIGNNLTIQSIPPGSASNSVCGTTVNGNLTFYNNGTAVQIGSASAFCPGNEIGGSLTALDDTNPVLIFDNSVGVNATVNNNTGSLDVVGNSVGNNLQCLNNSMLMMAVGNTARQKTGQCH
ncbi:MAG TPA: choice-of-anchor tandem repeat GloVer-containing protein [Stellaceae bacterium]|nr:choice-of-anchor tandem repeat GloVer-containing protein [Stellaceae bacterium]